MVISTSTSSGKSLVFSVPVFDRLLRDRAAVAILIFPTKALAQDQLRAVREFCRGSATLASAVRAATLDGDSSPAEREAACLGANLILTNPDMLHASVLPRHSQWKRVLSSLAFVVLDESHSYRGVFGTHVAMVLRRLVRLCRRYGADPRFFCCSATIANPAEHFAQLVPIGAVTQPAVAADGHEELAEPCSLPGKGGTGPACRFGTTQGTAVEARSMAARGADSGAESTATAGLPRPGGHWTAWEPTRSEASSTPAPTAAEDAISDCGGYVVVSRDTSAAGGRKLLLWNPPLVADLIERNKAEAEEWGGRALVDARQEVKRRKRERRPSDSSPHTAKVPRGDGQASDRGGGHARADSPDERSPSKSQAGAVALRDELAARSRTASSPAGSRSPARGAHSRFRGSTAMYKGAFRDRSRSAARGWEAVTGGKAARGVQIAAQLGGEARLRWPDGDAWPLPLEHELPREPSSLPSCAKGNLGGSGPAGQAQHSASSPAAGGETPAAAAAASTGHPRAGCLPGGAGQSLVPPAGWASALLETQAASAPSRKSAIVEASALLAALVEGGMRTLLFCKVRRVAELTLQYAHERLSAKAPHLISKVKSYRGGYIKEHRRAIEKQLFGGALLGVVATNALELGVDIGSLDCVVLLGYPGSAASMWQQAGRAGRGGRPAVAILVTFASPTEQFFVRQPEALVRKPPEAALIDTGNPHVLRAHAICAACEAPLAPWDLSLFGPELGTTLAGLRKQGILTRVPDHQDGGFGVLGEAAVAAPGAGATRHGPRGRELKPRAFGPAPWVHEAQRNVSLRSVDEKRVLVVDAGDRNRLIDDIEYSSALWEAYEGAIYMNQGVTYKVRERIAPCASAEAVFVCVFFGGAGTAAGCATTPGCSS